MQLCTCRKDARQQVKQLQSDLDQAHDAADAAASLHNVVQKECRTLSEQKEQLRSNLDKAHDATAAAASLHSALQKECRTLSEQKEQLQAQQQELLASR